MNVSKSAFNASASMLSGPDALPFFSFSMVFLISVLVGFSKLIGRGAFCRWYVVCVWGGGGGGGGGEIFRCWSVS